MGLGLRSSQLKFTIASFVGLFCQGMIIATPGAFLPQWQNVFGEQVSLGWYYNLFLLGGLVGLRLASTVQKRHPLVSCGFAAAAFGFSFAAVSANFLSIIIAAMFIGFGSGIINLQSNSMIGELHPQRRIAMLNWGSAIFGLGALSTPLLASFLPWRIALLLIATVALLGITLAWLAPCVLDFSPTDSKMPWSKARLLLLLFFLYVGLESSIGTWNNSYLLNLGWNEVASGTLLSFYWGGLTLGKAVLGTWVGKQPVRALKLLLLGALVLLGFICIPSLVILLPLAAFLYGPLFGTVLGLLQERCGHVALGYLFYAAYVGRTLIPASLGLLESPAYLPYGFVSLALILYLSSLRLK
ncbi:MAG: MFS transporter [Spirulinaceae cyanobacterium]